MQPQEFDIIVCGSLHLDIVVQSPHLPRLDETVPGFSWKKVCGGKGGNQAVMAARLKARTAMISRIGGDDFGAALLANLKSHGVDARSVSIDESAGSGMSVAIVDRNGDYGAVIVSGANLTLSPETAAEAWRMLGGAPVLILQNEIPEAVNIAVAQAAKASGSRVLLNAAPARPLSPALAELVDVLVVNRVEAEMLSGERVSDVGSAMSVLTLLARRHGDVVITLGGEGLVHGGKSRAPQAIAPVKVDVVSTHGAGDCFVGALAMRLVRNDTLEEACAHANRVAANYVAGRGLTEPAP